MYMKDFDADQWNKKEIVIYGAGEHGEIIGQGLLNEGIDKFLFCDSCPKKETLLGKEVVPFELVKDKETVNFIIGSGKYCIEIYRKLTADGIDFNSIYSGKKLYMKGFLGVDFTHSFVGVPKRFYYGIAVTELNAFLENKYYLDHLDLVITEICTLRCESCGSLMPLYACPHNCNKDVLLESFDRLLQAGCSIGVVDLIGGEPLVNQALIVEILEKYRDDARIGAFQIITNGTIIPSMSTIEAMKKTGNFYAIFSNYGTLSKNQKEAVRLLNENGVETVVEQEEDITELNNTLWIDYGEVKHYNKNSEQHQKMFDNCRDAKSCSTILNGKLYLCPRIAHMENLRLIPADSRNSLNLLDGSLSNGDGTDKKGILSKFFDEKTYPPACEYCNRDSGILVERAKQIKDRKYEKKQCVGQG